MKRELQTIGAVLFLMFAVLGAVTFFNVIVLDRPEFCQ